MHRRNVLIALAAAGAGQAALAHAQGMPFFGLGRPKPQPPLVFTYRGWRVDASRAARAQPADKTVRAVESQLDLVARQGLPDDILAVMRAAPILVADAGDGVAYAHGVVILDAKRLDPKKPQALIGLLQAYAEHGLPGGLANADVGRFRREALAAHVWPTSAMMLQSDAAFFALNAATYLVGATTREPYTRAQIQRLQPRLYQWLAALFDRGVARR